MFPSMNGEMAIINGYQYKSKYVFSHGNRVILILQQIMKQKNMVVGGLIPNRLPHPPLRNELAKSLLLVLSIQVFVYGFCWTRKKP